MFTPTLLAVVTRATDWSPSVAVVMIVCNVLAMAFAKTTVKNPQVGPSLPAPGFFGDMSAGAVLATWCLGHIFGAGAVLGLTQLGVL